jgi:Arc/MetJ-type ribon-helix-helix transcriptional regulator
MSRASNNKDFTLPCSVDIFLSPHYEKIISELAGTGEDELPRILVIHDAIFQMRASEMTKEEQMAELKAEIQKGLDSGEAREATKEFWESLKRECEEYHEWLKTQNVGNTLLPDELYEYIQTKIASGEYENATEVVCVALSGLQLRLSNVDLDELERIADKATKNKKPS